MHSIFFKFNDAANCYGYMAPVIYEQITMRQRWNGTQGVEQKYSITSLGASLSTTNSYSLAWDRTQARLSHGIANSSVDDLITVQSVFYSVFLVVNY